MRVRVCRQIWNCLCSSCCVFQMVEIVSADVVKFTITDASNIAVILATKIKNGSMQLWFKQLVGPPCENYGVVRLS